MKLEKIWSSSLLYTRRRRRCPECLHQCDQCDPELAWKPTQMTLGFHNYQYISR
jgi:hypothetical protein